MDMKMCTICNIEQHKDEFKGRGSQCKTCRNEKRRLAHNKICHICKISKNSGEFRRGQKICKECVEKENLSDKIMCNVCENILDSSNFYGASCICKGCSKKKMENKKSSTKLCERCNNEKECKYFRELSGKICMDCEIALETKRECRDCKVEKSISEFRPSRKQCKDCERADGRKYRRVTTKAKEWSEANKEKMTELHRQHYQKNKEEILEKERTRTKEDVGYGEVRKYKPCISSIIRGQINSSTKLKVKRDVFMNWLQFNFKNEMTADNYSELWCIDHVVPMSLLYDSCSLPCSKLIKKNPNAQKYIFCWYNTTPLLKIENRLKSDNVDISTLIAHIDCLKKFFRENKTVKKDSLYFEYRKFIRDILEFLS